MIATGTKRNGGGQPAGFGKATHTPNDTALRLGLQRSAVNWFLDAACYAMDGDVASARLATVEAISAMRAGR